jgi:hypothetical protein
MNPLGIDPKELDRYVTFEKGATPCIFRIQVEEGFARVNILDQQNLRIMLEYCEKKNYRVEWTSAVLKESAEARDFDGFPGGLYVAHLLDVEARGD